MSRLIQFVFFALLLLIITGCATRATATVAISETPGAAPPASAPASSAPAATVPTVPPFTATPLPTVAPMVAPTPTPAEIGPGRYLDFLVSGGQVRWFLAYVPSSYESGEPMPLVLNFHGAGSNYRIQEAGSGMTTKAEEAGFIVVYPKALGSRSVWQLVSQWESDIDLNLVRDLLDLLEANLSIDPQRVYATGFSNGASLANDLGCYLSDRIAAIAPVAGLYRYRQDCEPGRPVPVVAFHGTADTSAPYGGLGGLSVPDWAAKWAAHNGCDPTPVVSDEQGNVTGETWQHCDEDATVTLYTIEGGSHIWPGLQLALNQMDIDATDVMWDFFQAHPKP